MKRASWSCRILAFAMMLCFAFSIPNAEAGSCPAENYVISVGKAFTNASRSGSPGAFLNAANRFTNTRAIALSALGPYRKDLGSMEGEYVRLAQAYMGRFMAKHAGSLSAEGLKVTSCQGNTVTATANGGRKFIFRLNGSGGNYSLQDVNVGSVWLAGLLRNNFTGIIKRNNGGVNALMKFLRG